VQGAGFGAGGFACFLRGKELICSGASICGERSTDKNRARRQGEMGRDRCGSGGEEIEGKERRGVITEASSGQRPPETRHVGMRIRMWISKLLISILMFKRIWISVSVFEFNVVVKWIHPNLIFIIFLYPILHPYSTISETIHIHFQ
jgi:hypothetical protein